MQGFSEGHIHCIEGRRNVAHTGKRELFPIWEYGLGRGWTFKIVNQFPKHRISFGNIKCSDDFPIQRVF